MDITLSPNTDVAISFAAINYDLTNSLPVRSYFCLFPPPFASSFLRLLHLILCREKNYRVNLFRNVNMFLLSTFSANTLYIELKWILEYLDPLNGENKWSVHTKRNSHFIEYYVPIHSKSEFFSFSGIYSGSANFRSDYIRTLCIHS